jgi:hypothetical protein
MDTGVQRKLAGAGGTGKKGAMAVPTSYCQPKHFIPTARVTYTYLCREIGCTSPLQQMCQKFSGRGVTETCRRQIGQTQRSK